MNEAKLRRLSAAIRGALAAAVEEYANGKKRAVPIVDRHFTAGNQQRYGWEPLTKEYFDAKKKGIVKRGQYGLVLGAGVSTKGKKLSKLDPHAQFKGKYIRATGGLNLPMLVNSGALRAAINSGTHRIVATPDGSRVTVYFRNLPEYAKYLHSGTAKMPKRSPVQPNAEDYEQVYASARQYIDAVLRTGKTGRQAFGGGKARMV
jgi:hypothetical protein